MFLPDSTMDTVPVEVHEALKTAMEKLQVSKGSDLLSAPLSHQLDFQPVSDPCSTHNQIVGEYGAAVL